MLSNFLGTPFGARFGRTHPATWALALLASSDFDYPDFTSTSSLTLVGAAAQNGARVSLTPTVAGLAGGAWFDVAQAVAGGFDTTFSFQLSSSAGGDGFAFVVQNGASAPLGGDGCELGYHGLVNGLAIEFDTIVDATCGSSTVDDPNGLHLSVHTNGTAANDVDEAASLGSTLAVPDFADGAVHVARIAYASGTLSVFVDDLVTPALTVAVDLEQLLDLDQGRAWVGFTASTGAVAEEHDVLAWSFDSTARAVNSSPLAPTIIEPFVDGLVVNPADLHMETSAFQDPDVGDQQACTDWEVWTLTPSERVWSATCTRGIETLHTHLGDGVFENSHAGLDELAALTDFSLRVRHSDDSGDPATEWSPWAIRTFSTGSLKFAFPLALEDIVVAPAPRLVDASTGDAVILPPAATQPEVRVESAAGTPLLSIRANGVQLDEPALAGHMPLRVIVDGGSDGLVLPATDLVFVDEDCETHTILLPALTLAPSEIHCSWVSTVGATYLGDPSEGAPNLDQLERGLDPPWKARQPGFEVEVFAGGLQLPVGLAFVPNAGPDADDPFVYVVELYGRIAVVSRDGTVTTYADDLLDFDPTGAFPGSGEQGVAGLVVDPITGDVFATMLRASSGNPSVHVPKIDRFSSVDGGRTAAVRTTILDMPNEPQGQSHQISNLTLTPDGKLLCHVGDGFATATAQNLASFRGKVLRLELDGSACSDNPFYDPNDGITARDYVFAYGFRNPFGGEWRAADGHGYVVENGPTVDRFARLVAGRNYLWDGSDASMVNFALYNWSPPHAPVGLAFVQAETFGGSGFPASSLGHAFVAESGSTYAKGLQSTGKRITEWTLDANGELVDGPTVFLEYAGVGRATACGLEAGPDGLYMTELYHDQGTHAIEPGARILRIRYVAPPDCNGNDVDDICDLATETSADVNANGVPDECDCSGAAYCSAKINSLGCTPMIGANGALSLGAPDDFVIHASHVLNKKPGLLMRSAAAATIPFGGGTLCLQPPIQRFPPTNAGGSAVGLDCTGVYTRAITDGYLASSGLAAGSTVYFQFWSRDQGFAAPNNIGLSDALRVLVCP